MSHLQGSSSLKRKSEELGSVSQSLTHEERIFYDIILNRKEMGIWIADLKREAKLPDHIMKKTLMLLQTKKLIKEVVNIQNKRKKHYMATEFEPSEKITGGDWYTDGIFDIDFINLVKDVCLKYISKQTIPTSSDGISEWIAKSGVFSTKLTMRQIEEILGTLVLDDKITEVENTEFDGVRYKCKSKGNNVRAEQKSGAMASIPCGVCPRITDCTPNGKISPITCVYYQKWLDY